MLNSSSATWTTDLVKRSVLPVPSGPSGFPSFAGSRKKMQSGPLVIKAWKLQFDVGIVM